MALKSLQDNPAFGTDRPCCISKQWELTGVDLQRKTAAAEARYLQLKDFKQAILNYLWPTTQT